MQLPWLALLQGCTEEDGEGMISFCCLFQRLEGRFWIVNIPIAFLLLAMLGIGIRCRRNRKVHGDLHWWAGRTAVATFLLGCILFLLQTWHAAERRSPCGTATFAGIGYVVAVACRTAGGVFLAVAFAGLVIAMILRVTERE